MNKILNYKNLILFLILTLSAFIFSHNILFYPVKGGLDYARRTLYTKIISQEFRFPTYEETSQVYDAPLFYLSTGLAVRLISYMTSFEFSEAIGSMRFFLAFLGIISFFLWYKIFTDFYPKKKNAPIMFLLLLSSMPVFYKVGAMYVSELLTVFISTVSLYFFINQFLKKSTYKNAVILSILISIGLLTRISFFSLAFALFVGIIVLFFSKKKGLAVIKFLSIIASIILIMTGWFYLGRQAGKLTDFGTYAEIYKQDRSISLFKRQRLGFYFDIPFKLMMYYPIRPHLSRPAYFLPIYYSDFWGDYWNYFPQTRFGKDESQSARASRYSYSDTRRKYLAWQNRVNFVPTILMVVSFLYILITRTKYIIKKKINSRILTEFIFTLFVIFTWGSLTIVASKFPGEGDWIKASYSLYIVPLYAYFTAVFLFSYLKKIKIIFWPILIILLFSIGNNLIFSWF